CYTSTKAHAKRPLCPLWVSGRCLGLQGCSAAVCTCRGMRWSCFFACRLSVVGCPGGGGCAAALPGFSQSSQFRAPPVWYSMTRVSKKFFSLLRSTISDIHGNGFSAPG